MPRFQFSLRTLLIAVTVLAIPCGWLGWQAKIVRDRIATAREIEHEGGRLRSFINTGVVPWPKTPPTQPWYRRLFGDAIVDCIDLPPSMTSRQNEIQEQFPESEIIPRDRG